MQVYRYQVKVSKTGQINVDLSPDLFNKEVELTIVTKAEKQPISETAAMDFVEKWSGFMKNSAADDLKYSYLKDKYK